MCCQTPLHILHATYGQKAGEAPSWAGLEGMVVVAFMDRILPPFVLEATVVSALVCA